MYHYLLLFLQCLQYIVTKDPNFQISKVPNLPHMLILREYPQCALYILQKFKLHANMNACPKSKFQVVDDVISAMSAQPASEFDAWLSVLKQLLAVGAVYSMKRFMLNLKKLEQKQRHLVSDALGKYPNQHHM